LHGFVLAEIRTLRGPIHLVASSDSTRSTATAKSTARPSCLAGVLYDISREKIC